MSKLGLLIDYEYCTNCHTCEVGCKVEREIPDGKWGIKVFEVGPWQIDDDHWQLVFVPVPTDLCDLCASRTAKGKKPTCVHNCYSQCMVYGPVEELAKELEKKPRQVLFVPNQ
jgi:Fe-S-cluster-containing dehydrogenase component